MKLKYNRIRGERCSQNEFLEKAFKVHGNKYDYSETDYVKSNTKIKIICPVHGAFYPTPNAHLTGHQCPNCAWQKLRLERQTPLQNFIDKSNLVHSNKYDYSKIQYINCDTKVEIICPVHGAYWTKPYVHLNMKCGCRKCATDKRKKCKNIFRKKRTPKLTLKEFIDRATEIHKNKYDYSEIIDYQGVKNKVKIICPLHGPILQSPYYHLKGQGCSRCSRSKAWENKIEGFDGFVERANKIHNNKYQYIKGNYRKTIDFIGIICPLHGIFNQRGACHLRGKGCQKCGKEKIRLNNTKLFKQFVTEAKLKHGDKYTYIEKTYKKASDYVDIICPIHGEFRQHGMNHLKKGIGCEKCARKYGKDSPSWNHSITDEERKLSKERRHQTGYQIWRKTVYERDNYTCQITGQHGGKICAHHLESWSSNKELRMELSNGITISESLHKLFHTKYGIKNNTKEQFDEFTYQIKIGAIVI